MKNILNTLFKSSVVQNVTKLLSGNIAIQIVAFLLAIIITRLYTNDDFGLLAKFMSIAGVFTVISTARMEYAVILPKKDEEANELVSFGLVSAFFFAFVSFLMLFFFSEKINSYFAIDSAQDWIFLLPAVVFFSSSFNLFLSLTNRNKAYNKLILGQATTGISNPVSAIFLNKISSWGLIQSIAIAQFLGTLWLGFDFWKKNLFSFKVHFKDILKKYYHFPTYNLAHALINNLSSNLPVFMLSAVFENYLIGLFTMALGKIFKPINLFGNSIYQVLSAEMVDDLHQSKDVSKQFIKIVLSLFALGIVPFSILYFNANEIFAFVFGAQWEEAGTYLKDLLPWLFMIYLTTGFSFIPNLLKKQKAALIFEIIQFGLRFMALTVGLQEANLSKALSYYSAVGVFMLSIVLVWYYYLLKNKSKFNY